LKIVLAMRLVAWLAGCAVIPLGAAAVFETTGAVVAALACSVLATLWLVFWLPRAAHRAFETARYRTALRRYRLIGALAWTARRQREVVLSRTAYHLSAGPHPAARVLLDGFDGDGLDTNERVVWLNNRACVALDAGEDPAAALALIEQALALRPDVAAILHTRARALIALGRLDDAITVLDAMRAPGELSLRLEAERCRELAAAWEQKGQRDYAADYRDRARLHAI
jgi:tetratricopeptide (TPR) repeat protein